MILIKIRLQSQPSVRFCSLILNRMAFGIQNGWNLILNRQRFDSGALINRLSLATGTSKTVHMSLHMASQVIASESLGVGLGVHVQGYYINRNL